MYQNQNNRIDTSSFTYCELSKQAICSNSFADFSRNVDKHISSISLKCDLAKKLKLLNQFYFQQIQFLGIFYHLWIRQFIKVFCLSF